jgi:hypothetical protein
MSEKIDYTGAPEIGPKLNIGGGYNINASPQDFGSDMFAAIHGLGQAGEGAVEKQQKLANDIKHNELALSTSQKYNEEWERMASKEGMAAHDYLPMFQSNLKKIYDESLENAPNDAVRERLASTSFRDADRWMGHGTTYAGTQLRQAHKETHARSIDSNINQIEINRNQPIEALEDMVRRGHNGIGGENSVRETLFNSGKTPENSPGDYEDAIQKHWGMALGPTIKSLADNGETNHADLYKAKKLFDRNRDKMDSKTANYLDHMLKPKIDKVWVQEQADRDKPIPDEQGYIPTTKAEMKRFGVLEDERPTSANANLLGITRRDGRPSEYKGGKLPSDAEAAISRASSATGVDPNMLRTFANIESSGNKEVKTGKYSGLFQLSNEEFLSHGGGDIFNANDNAMAAARKLKQESADFKSKTGREPTGFDLYMIHQQGVAGAPAHMNNPSGIAWQNVSRYYPSEEVAKQAIWGNIPSDQKARFPGGVESVTSGQFIDMWRGKFSRLGGGEGENSPQAGLTGQDSVISPGYLAREAHRQSNLVRAHALAGGDPTREHALYTEYNRRDILVKTNLIGQRQVVQDTVKNLDLMASKGLPGATLESAGLSEDYIRSLWSDKPHIAEHIIENNRIQSQVADRLGSMKFAPKEDWDKFLVSTNQGLGIDTMIQQHRKKSGTTSAFEIGANPEASAEIMTNNFSLREKLAMTVRKAYDDRRTELEKDPANFLISSQNPAIMRAIQESSGAKNTGEAQASFRKYAALQTSIQRELGVPPDKIRVLSVRKAEEQTKAIMNSSDPKAEIDKMKITYGDMYPAVFRDVVALGKLPSKFESLSHIDAQNANVLSGMIKSEAEAKPNEHRRMMEGLLGKDRAVVVNAVRVGAAELMDSMAARRMTDPERKEKLDTITLLAEGRMRDFHETAAAASDEAVKAFTKDYKFVDRIAVPISKYQGVMAERKDRVRFLSPDSIVVPQSVSSEYHDKQSYTKAVQTGGTWVSTKEGNGMYLVDHWGNPVMTMLPSTTTYNDEAGEEKVTPGKPTPVKIMYDQTYGSISNIPGREANYKGR